MTQIMTQIIICPRCGRVSARLSVTGATVIFGAANRQHRQQTSLVPSASEHDSVGTNRKKKNENKTNERIMQTTILVYSTVAAKDKLLARWERGLPVNLRRRA